MKLLFINGHLNTGGVEKSLIDILQHLDYSRYDVDLLLLEELGDYAPLLPPQVHVKLKSIKNTYGPPLRTMIQSLKRRDWFCLKIRFIFLLMKLFGQDKISLAKHMLTDGKHYDCVIGYRRGICTQIASFAVNADRRLSWWHHGTINVDVKPYLTEVSNCSKIVVVSDAIRKKLSHAIPQLNSKLVTIPNMLDTEKIVSQAAASCPYKNRDTLHIVSIGGLVPEKHFENAIQAAKYLKDKGISFQWHLVGNGELYTQLKQHAEKADIMDCFIFEGNQANPYPYLKYADLFVHPSYVESQGIAILEAMALSVPCVVTKSLGPCEFIQDRFNGLLTEQSPESLSEKVLEILTNQTLYRHIKSNTNCPSHFMPENTMNLFYKMIGD